MSLLTVHNLQVSYANKIILSNVNIPDLNAGQMLGVLGPNAAGKSTLLKALSGQKSFDGELLIKGKPKSEVSVTEWRNQVALAPQTPPQPSSLLPFELLWSAARTLSMTLKDEKLEQLIDQIFSELGLKELATTPLQALSGGKRQTVGLALALIRNPTVLLLDEPTASLDLHWRMVVLDRVKQRIKKAKGCAIAALHDLDLAARYCDQLILLHDGQVVAQGTPSEVLTSENIAQVYRVEARILKSDNSYPLIQIENPIPSK